MLSQEEFITLYNQADPITKQAVAKVLKSKGKLSKHELRQIMITCGVEQEQIEEWERKYMPDAL